jgi:hypothetical protein
MMAGLALTVIALRVLALRAGVRGCWALSRCLNVEQSGKVAFSAEKRQEIVVFFRRPWLLAVNGVSEGLGWPAGNSFERRCCTVKNRCAYCVFSRRRGITAVGTGDWNVLGARRTVLATKHSLQPGELAGGVAQATIYAVTCSRFR